MEKERVAIFIDGSNFYHSTRKLNTVDKINFQKLINELVGDRELIKVFYYNSPLDLSVNPKIYWKQQKHQLHHPVLSGQGNRDPFRQFIEHPFRSG